MTGIQLRNLKVEALEAATLAALKTAVNDWLVARGEEVLVHVRFQTGGTGFLAFILYAEE